MQIGQLKRRAFITLLGGAAVACSVRSLDLDKSGCHAPI
jgi:hypothetical protein